MAKSTFENARNAYPTLRLTKLAKSDAWLLLSDRLDRKTLDTQDRRIIRSLARALGVVPCDIAAMQREYRAELRVIRREQRTA